MLVLPLSQGNKLCEKVVVESLAKIYPKYAAESTQFMH